MIQFGTGGWRAVIGDGFIKENIQRIAAALARRMKREEERSRAIAPELRESGDVEVTDFDDLME